MTGAYPVCDFILLSSWEQWWQHVTGWESRGLDEIKLMIKVKLLSTLSLQIMTFMTITGGGLDALEGMRRFSQQTENKLKSLTCLIFVFLLYRLVNKTLFILKLLCVGLRIASLQQGVELYNLFLLCNRKVELHRAGGVMSSSVNSLHLKLISRVSVATTWCLLAYAEITSQASAVKTQW